MSDITFQSVREKYALGQRMFQRPSVKALLARIDELEIQLSAPPVITAKSETVQFPCDSCGPQAHTIFTMGTVDVCQCTRCNKIAAVV